MYWTWEVVVDSIGCHPTRELQFRPPPCYRYSFRQECWSWTFVWDFWHSKGKPVFRLVLPFAIYDDDYFWSRSSKTAVTEMVAKQGQEWGIIQLGWQGGIECVKSAHVFYESNQGKGKEEKLWGTSWQTAYKSIPTEHYLFQLKLVESPLLRDKTWGLLFWKWSKERLGLFHMFKICSLLFVLCKSRGGHFESF